MSILSTSGQAIDVKDIRIDRIDSTSANAFVRRWHYSGTVTNNSQLHFGAFFSGKLHGVMSFGPPMDRRRILPLVEGTGWSQMVELNRMAFDETLPKNSESRSLSIALRLIRKHAPHVKWVVSFSDACRSGDGTIYRACGFLLTQINRNKTILRLPDGTIRANLAFHLGKHALKTGKASEPEGAVPIPGFQLRYIYFLDPAWRARLTVPVLPYSAIAEAGAKMYRGQSLAK